MTGEELQPLDEMTREELRLEAESARACASRESVDSLRDDYIKYAQKVERVIERKLIQELYG